MLLKPEVLAALNKQIAHEASNEQIYRVSEKAADYGTCAWLNKPDGLILEQIEEEGLAQDMISRAELACKCQSPNLGVLTWDIELLERFNA